MAYLFKRTLSLALFFYSLLCVTGLTASADAIVPPAVVRSSLLEIQEFLKSSRPYVGEGAQYGHHFLIEVSPEVAENKLWQMKVVNESSTLQISSVALQGGLSLTQWTTLVGQIFQAHSWMPLGLMIQQNILASPESSKAEIASVEANTLSFLKDRLAPKSGGIWDAARAIFDPADPHAQSETISRVYLKSVGPLFGDALERRSNDRADIVNRVGILAVKLETVFNDMLNERLETIRQFQDAQKTVSKFKQTSGTVSDLVRLVEANDREGVAKLMESSLSWDLFTPMENRIYRQFIEAIRHPNKSDSVYLLRGTSLKLDPAPEALGLMSKLFKLPKFQSLTVNEVFAGYREDWASTAVNRKTDIPFPSFFNLGENHSHSSSSIDGHPSAMLSTSAAAPVVTKFAKGSKVMMRVDARRVYPNYESMMYFEREVLIPFFVFPDEIEGELVKDEVSKKPVIQRIKDKTINLEATEFLKKNMARDVQALPYIISIWEKTFQHFFPASMAVSPSRPNSVRQCLRFYSGQ